MPHICEVVGRAHSGDPGKTGAVPPPRPEGVPGVRGTISRQVGSAAISLKHLDFTMLRMVLHDAELDYLNDRRKLAAQKLFWLLELAEAGGEIGQEISRAEPSIPVDGPAAHNLASILFRARVLLVQLSQGLDVYGYYPGFVPLTSVEIYKTVVGELLALAEKIESAFERYHQQQQTDLSKREALITAVDVLEHKQPALQRQANQVAQEIFHTREAVSALLVEEESLRLLVERAREEFKKAVARQAACGFDDVLKAAAAVAAIGAGVGAIAAGVGGLAEMSTLIEQKKLKDSLKEKGKYVVGEFKVIGGGIEQIKSGYSSIKEVLQRERDAAKLIADETEFEASVKQFEDLPEAREYRRLMRQLIGVIKARNAKIIHVDSLVTRVLEIESEQDQLELEIDRTRSRLVDVFNPRLSEHVVFFERAIARVRADILRAIVMEHRALEYWSLKSSKLPRNLKDANVAQLQSYQASFIARYLEAIEERNQAPQKLDDIVEFAFTREDHPEAWHLLESGGSFSFRLSSNESAFRFLSHVLVNRATISFVGRDGSSSNVRREVLLGHHGDPEMVDSIGQVYRFSHRPRLSYARVSGNNATVEISLGGLEGKYAFLSPFATWTVSIEPEKEGMHEIEELQAVTIKFSGIAYARYGSV